MGDIETHLLDLLEADTSLYVGGDYYSTGFGGVVRVKDDQAQDGKVNLFDHALSLAGGRPAIFVGLPEMQDDEEIEMEMHSGGEIDFLVKRVMLVIVARDKSQSVATQMRRQLVQNVRRILMQKCVEDGYWYDLRVGRARGRATSTSDGNSVADSIAVLVCEASYTLCRGDD